MLKLILSRAAQAIPVLLLVILITFSMVRLAPGGPFDAEKAVSPEVLENLKARYDLDKPFYLQFANYIANAAQGDLGPSFKFPNRSVNEMIASGFPVTLELAAYALLVAISVGLLAGITASLRANTWQDYLPMSAAMLGICLPSFVLGPLLVLLFGIWLEWLPVAGWGVIPGDKILPAITLGLTYAAYVARIVRGSLIETLAQDYIRTAKAKGLKPARIVLRHALPAALTPVVSFLGPAIAGLIAGSFVVETIFQIPGLGRFYIQAAFNRDYTMILGTTIFFSVLIIFFNLLADIVLAWLNPKLRFSGAES
ncbi:MAG: ABC transporter permease subunit [Cellvibrionaceae bacterium]|nr:ABC transporter permease subunit [Cellvibrionaceae bacterium]